MNKRKSVIITIDEDQHQWMKDHHYNLSSFVRARIEILRDEIDGKRDNREVFK